MKLLPQEENYFGLDLGSNSIKLAQLREIGGKPSLVTYGDVELESKLILSDSELDLRRLSDSIKQLADDAKVTTKNVVASLNANQSYTATISTPKLNHSELAESIKFQASKVIPMDISKVKLDWAIINDDPNSEELDVLIVAAPNTIANKFLSIVQNAGLELMALELNSIAQARSLVREIDRNKCLAIVDIGSVSSDIAIVDSLVPKLVRSAAVGGESLNRVVSQNLAIDTTQADQFIKKFGMDQTKIEGQVYKTLKPMIDHLAEELNKSISYFQEANTGKKIDKIVITGGTSALIGLPLYLANSTSHVVEIGNPWQNISYPAELSTSLSSLSLDYATAIGLALRGYKL